MTDATAALRAFNRFYTRHVGALDPAYLGSDLSLAEARLLYEIEVGGTHIARTLIDSLGLDPGYASRLLKRLESRGLIERGRGSDARQRPIALTETGRAAFEALDKATHDHVAASIAQLTETDRRQLVGALATVAALLGEGRSLPWQIRTFQPGDMGLITSRQSILYHEHWGWGTGLEALEAEITASFLREFRPGRDQCWVAEQGGRMMGAIFCIDSGDNAAQLRLLHVEPEARGQGIGEALVRTCIAFARDSGYDRIWLWTHAVLLSARKIYAACGFSVIASAMHDDFGKAELGETWELVFDR